MKKLLLLLSVLGYFIIHTRCTQDKIVEVYIYTPEFNSILKFDNDTIIIDRSKTFQEISVSIGEHVFYSNGLFNDTINIQRSGLLVSKNIDFVVFPMSYTSNGIVLNSLTAPSSIIVGDSMIIYDNTVCKSQSELLDKMKSEMDINRINPEGEEKKYSRMGDLRTLEFGKNKFIYKTWDYTVDNFPKDIKSKLDTDFAINKGVLASKDKFVDYCKTTERFNIEKIEDESTIEFILKYRKY